jgi:hypothetical protein
MQQNEQAINRKASRLVTGAPDTPTTVPTHILSDCNLSPFGSIKPEHHNYAHGLSCLTCLHSKHRPNSTITFYNL